MNMINHIAIISLGSNIENGELQLHNAYNIIRMWFREAKHSAPLSTVAIGMPEGTPNYSNMLVCVTTTLSLASMTSLTKELERLMGDTRENRNKNIVAMDVDIVEFDKEILKVHDYQRSYYQALRPSILNNNINDEKY